MLRSTIRAIPRQALAHNTRNLARVPLVYSVHRLQSTSVATTQFTEPEPAQETPTIKNNAPNNTEPLNGENKKLQITACY